MADVKHTPGPWLLDIRTGEIMKETPRGGPCRIADIVRFGTKRETDANARLIAAAPELLATLEAAIAFLDQRGTILNSDAPRQMMLVAIDKAKGIMP